MAASDLQNNPFKVWSPEKLAAEDAVHLFVDVFTDFYKVRDAGHAFLNGPRGSGKSMMFRYLRPDCQCLAMKRRLHEIEFFSVYIPLKNTSLNVSELDRIERGRGSVQINEHLMVLYFAVEALASVVKAMPLCEHDSIGQPSCCDELLRSVVRILAFLGERVEVEDWQKNTVQGRLEALRDYFQGWYTRALQYVRKLSFAKELDAPDGPLLGYMDFLFPLLEGIMALPFMPSGPMYLLVDDADNLSLAQTKVLNTWVSSRTSTGVSIKISTQMDYKTYVTNTNRSIDSTHDFSEVNITDIYTSIRGRYLSRVEDIVKKRLALYNVTREDGHPVMPREFFPPYEKQEKEIEAIREKLRRDFPESGRGFRASDDVVRYARPMYMASLAGSKKASSKYMYAGFEQLVHVSSGVVRHFLEPASNMFSEVQANKPKKKITFIPPDIQDDVIRADSYNFRFKELESIREDQDVPPQTLEAINKLGNLIEVLGGVFHKCLLSEGRAERRVFSIALYDQPDDELREVLNLGVRYGYFHRSSIGKKDGSGRTRLYILSRRLAPAFKLDPNGFVGYLWLSSSILHEAIYRPTVLLNRIHGQGIDELSDVQQLTLFD